MQIKICGITTVEEALIAAELGATHLGLNFYPSSPRYLSRTAAYEICAAVHRLPHPPVLVGVFVNESPDAITSTVDACQLDLVQLSGDELPGTLRALGPRAFKAVRLKDSHDDYLPAYRDDFQISNPQSPDLLLDAHVRGMYGGTGTTVDWARAANLARQCRLILAGGLTPDNVADAMRAVRPWGVDVASGVESAPGVKDPTKMAAFIANARTVATPEAGAQLSNPHLYVCLDQQ